MATGFSSGRVTINSHAVLPAVIIGVSEEGTIGLLQVLVSLEHALEIATKITAAVERLRAEKGAPVMTTHRSDRGRIATPDGDNDSHLQRDSAPSFWTCVQPPVFNPASAPREATNDQQG